MHARRPEADRGRGAASHVAAALLLALMAWLADSSTARKSPTFDETSHLVSGLSFWRTGDFRLDPESGAFPQLWVALPAWLGGAAAPEFSGRLWQQGEDWALAHELFYRVGNDPERLLRGARRMVLLLTLGLGALVYAWAFRLHGAAGGLVSLWLYAFCPNLLAHGRLATADMAQAAFFLLCLAAFARLLRQVDAPRIAACGAAAGLLMLSKFGGLLVWPVFGVLAALRALSPVPLRVGWPRSGPVEGAARRLAVLTAALAGVAAVAAAAIWAAYGFSYRARGPDHEFNWPRVEATPGLLPAAVLAARDRRLLPEPWLYGLGYTHWSTLERVAFLRGERSTTGWWWYFPYALAVKTPLATLALWALAAGVGLAGWRRGPRRAAWDPLPRTAPLWTLLVLYWAFSLGSQINIGLRHLLPTLPPAMILAGSAARLGRRPVGAVALALLLAGTAVASWSVRPHYLAFFNAAAGGPAEGPRLLIDSNLDWGQDLPGLADWLAAERARGEAAPCYLSYFGSALPEHHGVSCRRLPGFFDAFRSREPGPLEPGLYAVSATMLQALHLPPAVRGAWTPEREARWRELRRLVAEEDAAGRRDWTPLREAHELYRFARLLSWLREREPDARIGWSLLVYRLEAGDLAAALEGPLAEPGGR